MMTMMIVMTMMMMMMMMMMMVVEVVILSLENKKEMSHSQVESSPFLFWGKKLKEKNKTDHI